MSFVDLYADLESLAMFLRTEAEHSEGTSRVVAAMNGNKAGYLQGRAVRFHKAAEWLIWLARHTDQIEKIGVERWDRKPNPSTPHRNPKTKQS